MNSFYSKYKDNKTYSIFCLLLLGCAICQLVLTTYFNIFEGRSHMGIDSSWEYLKVIISAKEGTLFPFRYANPTTQPEFERIVLAAPLYKLLGNIFAAYGIANLVCTIICMILLYLVMSNLGCKLSTKLIVINLFLCPYLSNGYDVTNELGYHECVNGFAAYQNIVSIVIFLVILITIQFNSEKISIPLVAITCISIIYVCINKGMGLVVWLGVPIVIYIFGKSFIENEVRTFFSKQSICLILFVVCMFAGRFIGGIMGLTYMDSGLRWADASELMRNIGNVLVGIILLLGGIPAEGVSRVPTSAMGIVYCFGLIIAGVLLTAIIYWIMQMVHDFNKGELNYNILFLLSIVIGNIIFFSLIAPYDQVAGTYEVRYLIPAVFAGFVLTGAFIENISGDWLLKKMGIIALFVSIVALDLYSDYFLAISDNEYLQTEELLAQVEKTDAGIVYFWDSEKELVQPERLIRVKDTNRVYKSISYADQLEDFGDYNYYDDSSLYNGASLIITKSGDKVIPDSLLDQYELLSSVGNYELYYSDTNPVDLKAFVRYRSEE